jgi:resuscitation-promoting factor RpfB
MNGRRLRRMVRRHPLASLVLAVVVLAGAGQVTAAASAPSPASGNVALGQQLAAAHGWTGQQWACLDDLWQRESGWSNTAENPSDAYGIAQALGHGPTNQYPAGPANPPTSSAGAQIRWGLGYIRATYGTPCGAWQHEEDDGWY